MKIIGIRKIRTPEEGLRRLEALHKEAEIPRPCKSKKSVVMKFKTWNDLYEFSITRASKE